MPVTESSRRAHAKYMKENYSRLNIQYPTEFITELKAAVAISGESLAGYVRKAIEERISRDSEENKKTAP